jgi:glycosyltransferase involved in cell wall biosynthesis
MKIALVHDELIQWGGAERLLLAMHKIWPDAPIYTSIYAPENLPKEFRKIDVRTSFMQKLPFSRALRRQYFFLYPIAFESFDFSGFDVVLSSSTRFAHGIITKPATLHICYSNSPTRFLWETEEYLEGEKISPIGKIFLAPFLSYLRVWDQTAVQRPDFWIANSKNVAEKLKKFYRKDSTVIYPGVDLKRFQQPATRDQKKAGSWSLETGYFLIVSRLLAWKRIELAIKACNKLKLSLKIAGQGPDYARLKSLANSSKVEFLEKVSEEELISLYKNCKALIVTQEEDFGITAVEAQAAGVPVIAYKGGGAKETIIEGKTGLFFFPQDAGALEKTIVQFDKIKIEPQECIKSACKFSLQVSQGQLKDFVETKWQKSRNQN